MMTPTARAARITARMLARPTRFANTEGRPKTPLPIMQLMTSAARLQRPISRASRSLEVFSSRVSVTASLYHKPRACWCVSRESSRIQQVRNQRWCVHLLRKGPPCMATERRCIFITGGTGYMGQRLIPRLLTRGHIVRALVRPGSEKKLPGGCIPILRDALDGSSYAGQVSPADTFVQMVGTVHPSPAKAAEFRRIDLPSGLGAVRAAKYAGIRHFVYVSVAQPAPMMHAYIAVRAECEAAIASAA